MPLDLAFIGIQLLNGLQLASLLFLLSVGLSVVFGLMNFINLAHGTLYMLGAFIGLSLARWTGSYWIALALAPLAVAALGALFHVALLRRLQVAAPMKQVLVTFGLIFIGLDSVRYIWGNHINIGKRGPGIGVSRVPLDRALETIAQPKMPFCTQGSEIGRHAQDTVIGV